MKTAVSLLSGMLILMTTYSADGQSKWNQFRGTGSAGIAPADADPPAILNPATNMAWKISIADGLSSPCISGNNIFVTGYNKADTALVTYCIDRTKGTVAWEKKVTPGKLEAYHQIAGPAIPTPAANEKVVIVYFGCYGVLCYDMKGKLMWEYKIPVAKNFYGSAASPVISNNMVLINRNDQNNPSVLALDLTTGKKIWENFRDKNRSIPKIFIQLIGFVPSQTFATPVIWKDQVIIHSLFEICSLRIKDGSDAWSLSITTAGNSTPVISGDLLILNGYYNRGDPALYDRLPAFEEVTAKFDRNKNNLVEIDEIPSEWAMQKRPELADMDLENPYDKLLPMRLYAGRYDQNKDKSLNRDEWQELTKMCENMIFEHGVMAFRLDQANPEKTPQQVWKVSENVPEVPSVLVHGERVYLICDGGKVSCIARQTGKTIFVNRINAGGSYLASPLYAGGKIFLTSYNGIVTVMKDNGKPEIEGQSDLRERIGASPAALGKTVYIRSKTALMAFENK